jgi:hypothetical protein
MPTLATSPASQPSRPHPLYFVETLLPRTRVRCFIEVDRDSNSRAAVLDLIRTGEVDPVTVLEIDETEGTARNVTAEIVAAASDAREAA